jgi:predicted acetyltransferase
VTIETRPLMLDRPDPDLAFQLLVDVDHQAFLEEATPEHLLLEKALLEFDRAFLAWEGSEPIGCSATYSMNFSIPGGEVPAAGVTWVGVLPTHRRRGAMSQLLNATHQEIHDSGREPIAALWASQPPIYGRFGYGLAAPSLSVVIPSAHGSLSRAPKNPDLTMCLLSPAQDQSTTAIVYSKLREERPGMPIVDDRWHASIVSDPKGDREGASALQTVVVEDDQGPLGYARYAIKHNWASGYADGQVNVRQLIATDAAAEAELWRYLIEDDLVSSVDAWNLPSDTPLQRWLDQPRHVKRQLHDSLYVRLVDVPAALAARTYSLPIDLVIEVEDKHCPWNDGRWRLQGDESGARCSASSDPADLSVDVAMLGAVYLGGTSFNDLSAAGWIPSRSSHVVRQASQAFAHHPAPWSPFVF